MYFALVLKGADGALLVDKQKVKKNDLEAAKKQSGGSTVIQGTCYGGDDGVLMFETAKAPAPTWAAIVKKIATRDAGVSLKAEFVQGGGGEEEGGESEGEEGSAPSPTKAPGNAAALFAARLKSLLPQVKDALTAKLPAGEEAKQCATEASNLARSNDYDKANALLDTAEALLKNAAAPTAPAKPPTPSPGDGAAAFTARLKALMPAIKNAASTASAKQINLFTAEAGTFAKQQDFAQANKRLDAVELLLRRAAAPSTPAAPTGVPATVTAEIAKPAVVAQLAAKTGKVAAPRPTASPRTALTNNVLNAVLEKNPPENVEDMPDHVAALVPQFLMAVSTELSQRSEALQAGGAVPAQDQMLAVADTLNAAMRSMRAWEAFLKQGEETGKRLDQLDQSKEEREEKEQEEYETVLERYNGARSGGLEEQARTLKLAQKLMGEYKALQAAAPKA